MLMTLCENTIAPIRAMPCHAKNEGNALWRMKQNATAAAHITCVYCARDLHSHTHTTRYRAPTNEIQMLFKCTLGRTRASIHCAECEPYILWMDNEMRWKRIAQPIDRYYNYRMAHGHWPRAWNEETIWCEVKTDFICNQTITNQVDTIQCSIRFNQMKMAISSWM